MINAKEITLEYFENNYDEIIELVEQGNSFLITTKKGNVMLMPHSNSTDDSDDLIRIHTDHEEGC